MGRMILNSPEEAEFLIEGYFAECEEKKRPLTFAGLAYALGFTSTGSLRKYRKDESHAEFNDLMEHACLRIEQFLEEQLYNKGVNVAGPIFALKARAGLSDRDPNDKGSNVTIKINGLDAKL